MARLDALFAEYGSAHQTRGNRICHGFGIPLIIYGILSLLLELRLPIAPWTGAELAIAATVLFDLRLDPTLALAMAGESMALDLAARAAGSWRLGLAAFVIGWILQAVGHARFERNRPAFFRNLVHLLVGPLFFWNELLRVRRPERP